MATVDITFYAGADAITRVSLGTLISRATITIGTGNQYTQIPTNAGVALITARGGDALVAFGSDNTITPSGTNSQLILSGITLPSKHVTAGNYIGVSAG